MTNEAASTYFSEFFHYESGYLYCEETNVGDVREYVKSSCFPSSPFFLYSRNQIRHNVRAYQQALNQHGFKSQLNFSAKANPNIAILKELRTLNCSITLVSGMELKLALSLNFDPSLLMFNGNGKVDWEVELAVQERVMLNIDGAFNLEQTIRICRNLNSTARVLLRINPNIHVDAHQYLRTGELGSKFGTHIEEMDDMLEILRHASEVTLVGLHCHLGSTIERVDMYRKSVILMTAKFEELKNEFSALKYLNIGGGLGIPYDKHAARTTPCLQPPIWEISKHGDTETFQQSASSERDVVSQYDFEMEMKQLVDEDVPSADNRSSSTSNQGHSSTNPSPADLVASFSDMIDDDMVVILEPGRSLVGNAAILVSSVLGCKTSGDKNMTEVIRPSLYGAYHHIDLTEPTRHSAGKKVYDVVGPVCECGDFLGKGRLLNTPHSGCGLAVFDVGAYCSSQASNYNLRLRPAEVIVDGQTWKLVRRPDSFDDLVRPFMV
ncbi:diaminopimelate decarboxylase 2, chloroplastic-like isoform X2 [Mizuhopecten yessoensis]|uniref:diaminopimelate decarboxylase 2, chloroplastic-like isoform X2 n=1 Tax=Mizuhopecten yessoensis TaxID=6573 RepID=UPI000B45D220|nr:diaminopimelate decarboxylase 2, chloroplastic-like isoform X2 [Mizuhopecten yessoensis]